MFSLIRHHRLQEILVSSIISTLLLFALFSNLACPSQRKNSDNSNNPTPNLIFSSDASASVDSDNDVSILEGDSITITLETKNMADGTEIAYTLSGITLEDLIRPTSLMGNFIVQNNSASLEIELATDNIRGESEILTVSLDDFPEKTFVIAINDPPTYILSTAGITSIDEGSAVTITLTLDNTSLPDNTEVAYTLSGITLEDLTRPANLTGNFIIQNNSASLEIELATDNLVENAETLTISLTDLPENINVDDLQLTINDRTPTYILSSMGDVTSLNEGEIITITLGTRHVPR